MTTSAPTTLPPDDTVRMRRALNLAQEAIGLSDPNPRVGCVICDAEGRLLGEGHTQAAGGPHAEVMALRAARDAGHDVRGATAYVSLEPCAHHGRTPPCCDALIAAGVGRVVAAMVDPFPQVAGQGLQRLAAAGISVEVGPCADEARELNIGFLSRLERGRPWVRLKLATSLDGRTALENGQSQWITGAAARSDGHLWRKRAGAVLTGVGTVLADDPRLDVRSVPTARQPLRVVLDSALRTPPPARILDAPGPCLIYAATLDASRSPALQERGAEIVALPGPDGRIDLAAALDDLGRRGINELHVEAGHTLNGALIHADLVDEYLIYLAPKLLGRGPGAAALGALDRLDQAPALRFIDMSMRGDDLRLIARRAGPERF